MKIGGMACSFRVETITKGHVWKGMKNIGRLGPRGWTLVGGKRDVAAPSERGQQAVKET